MGICKTLKAIVARPTARVVEGPVRELVDEILRTRDYVRSSELQGLRAQLARRDAELKALGERINTAEAALTAANERLATLSTPAPTAPADRGCQVDGCTSKHRARGLCGKHYELWRRGNLPGFVGREGQLRFSEDTPQLTVSADLAGKAATLVDGIVHVDGAPVAAMEG